MDENNLSDINCNEVDLTELFINLKTRVINEEDVRHFINRILGKYFRTSSGLMQVGITSENKIHILKTNIKLRGNYAFRHNAAILKIERIINNAKRMDRDGIVDLSHNSRRKTLKHKARVLEYIYFCSNIRIYDNSFTVELATERMKGRNPELLDLYNIRVKRNPAATQLSALQTGVD